MIRNTDIKPMNDPIAPMNLDRRQVLALAAAGAALAPRAGRAAEADAARSHRSLALAATWRGPAESDPHHAGVIELDGDASRLAIRWSQPLPSRAHGLHVLPDGSLVVVAMRPGRWLLRLAADGRLLRRQWMDDEPDGHRVDGHALATADGRVLFTPQTDRAGQGWIAVRDAGTLALLDRWPLPGVDPHQLLLDAQGQIVLALGGIRRSADGRKVELDRMASALLRIDSRSGALLGRWTLADPRLSLRHLAWSHPAGREAPRLGIALQAEHDDPAARAAAPLLAWWDGQALHTALGERALAGYAGDISAAPGGGFALSAQMAGRALAWQPGPPAGAATIAELRQPCALASPQQGDHAGAVLLAAAAGLARWHPRQPPRLLRWPAPMVLDNHWVVLEA